MINHCQSCIHGAKRAVSLVYHQLQEAYNSSERQRSEIFYWHLEDWQMKTPSADGSYGSQKARPVLPYWMLSLDSTAWARYSNVIKGGFLVQNMLRSSLQSSWSIQAGAAHDITCYTRFRKKRNAGFCSPSQLPVPGEKTKWDAAVHPRACRP